MAEKTAAELKARDRNALLSLILGVLVIVAGIAMADLGMGWVALLGLVLAVNGWWFYRRR